MLGNPDLLLVVEALVVVFQDRRALLLARVILRVGVDDVACEQLLPEGKASGGTYEVISNWSWVVGLVGAIGAIGDQELTYPRSCHIRTP